MGTIIKFPVPDNTYSDRVRTMINGIEHIVEYDSKNRVAMVQDTEPNGSYTRTVWDYENQKIYSETNGPRA